MKTRKFKVKGHIKKINGKTTYAFGYFRWRTMWARCEFPSCPEFKRYGARGITVCDEWRDFWVFQKWLIKHHQQGKTMDRIDNDGSYSPANVGWATPLEQQLNSRITPARLAGMRKAKAAQIKWLHRKFGNPYTRKTKVCGRCDIRKKRVHFRQRSGRPDQVPYCRPCERKYHSEYAKRNRNKINIE